MGKITKATFKKFLRNNNDLYVKNKMGFDGMEDSVVNLNKGWKEAERTDRHVGNTLGLNGVWLVNGSRDYFNDYEDEEFQGIDVSNCCGHFIVATKKYNV